MKKQLIFASLFLIGLLYLNSCSAKAEEIKSNESLTGLFNAAGLPLLKNRFPVRDFSLPLAGQAAAPLVSAVNQSPGDYKGKVVFLNFWATWCGPCRSEMPSMEALYRRYKDRGLEILAVNSMEREQDVLAFMKNYELSFPALLDTDGKVGSSYAVRAIPTTYLIDRNGMIVTGLTGTIDWDTPKIHAAIEALLEE